MALKEYNEKRNFRSSKEPKGKLDNKKGNRFVIQYHQARAKHYDFRLEHKGVLLSWAVPKGLSHNPKDKRLAVMVEDHPVDYINFEGIIPKGNYGAGTVEIFDKGNFLAIEDLDKGLKKGHIKVFLNGEKVKGGWSLIKIEDNNWLAVKLDDEFAVYKNTTIKKKLPFKDCPPMLATLSDKIPRGKDWVYEIKYDGYRMVSYVQNQKVCIKSRNGKDWTKKFEKVCASLKDIDNPAFIVDGEIVVFDEKGKTDFGLLQESIKKGEKDFYYIIFDLLAVDGKDIRELSLKERKEKLERLLYKANKNLIFSKHFEKGKESFEFAKKNSLEGIVAKKLSSPYISERSEDWLKIKCYLRQEFVIGGFSTSDKNQYISALLLGYYQKDKFIYVGKVGTGFDDKTKKELYEKFEKFKTTACPFENKLKQKNINYIKPHFVAEIQFAELTKENLLRQPSFIGLREDKNAKKVHLEFKNEKRD